MKVFWGKNSGIIALAKNYPVGKIKIKISRDFPNKEVIQESDFWLPAIKDIVEEKTKFGRIGIFFDRKNKEAGAFSQTLAKQKFNYTQKNPRAEKSAKFIIIKTQILQEMANEGLTDSVEFRTILRKYIRNVKSQHLDSVLFLEAIFAEKKTKKIIRQISGTQIKTYFITDFISTEFELSTCQNESSSNSKKYENPAPVDRNLNSLEISSEGEGETFQIKTEDDVKFTKKRAEQILQKKLKLSDIIPLD